MTPGFNGSNSGSSRDSGVSHPTGSLGTIPKVKSRKKVASQPFTNPTQQPQIAHQNHTQSSQQFLPWIHPQSALNGQFSNGCNNGLPTYNGFSQTSGHKNIAKNQVSLLAK